MKRVEKRRNDCLAKTLIITALVNLVTALIKLIHSLIDTGP